MNEWISIEEKYLELDMILCYGEDKIFICIWRETKWGNRYHSVDQANRYAEVTHWMPLPDPPMPSESH